MKPQQFVAKLERMVSGDLPKLAQNFFDRHGDRYHVFDRYEIRLHRQQYQVIKLTSDPISFGSLPTAVAYCIADKYQQHNLSLQIRQLDEKVRMLRQDIDVRDACRTRIKNADIREAAALKLQHRKDRLRSLSSHLDKYVNQAKYWQIRGFNNEAARTGRPASNRTN